MRAWIKLAGDVGIIAGPDVRDATAAHEWARGYLKPGRELPIGSTVTIGGTVYLIDPERRTLRLLGE